MQTKEAVSGYWGEVAVCHRPTGVDKVLSSYLGLFVCLFVFFKPFLNRPRGASRGLHLPEREREREETEMFNKPEHGLSEKAVFRGWICFTNLKKQHTLKTHYTLKDI